MNADERKARLRPLLARPRRRDGFGLGLAIVERLSSRTAARSNSAKGPQAASTPLSGSIGLRVGLVRPRKRAPVPEHVARGWGGLGLCPDVKAVGLMRVKAEAKSRRGGVLVASESEGSQ